MVDGSIPRPIKVSLRTGCLAFWQRRRTRFSVSSPERVVKSMQEIAFSNQAA